MFWCKSAAFFGFLISMLPNTDYPQWTKSMQRVKVSYDLGHIASRSSNEVVLSSRSVRCILERIIFAKNLWIPLMHWKSNILLLL